MRFLANYAARRIKKIERNFRTLYLERERLREICIPYKLEREDGGYFNREDIQMSAARLNEIEAVLNQRRTNIFYKVLNRVVGSVL